MNTIEEYDGVITSKNESGDIVETKINSDLAINRENDPRKCFLIGQLHIEYYCDMIISSYFSDNLQKKDSMNEFLKSRFMTFNNKIEFLKLLKNSDEELLIDKKLIDSLIVIAEIRNTFQHNLGRNDAMNSLGKNRRKLTIGETSKKLNEYTDSISLMKDFKIFFKQVYPKLIAIWIKLSMSKEEQKKFLSSIAKDE